MTRFLKVVVIQQKADITLTSNIDFKSYNWVVQPQAFQLKALLTRPPMKFKRHPIAWLLAIQHDGSNQIPLSYVKYVYIYSLQQCICIGCQVYLKNIILKTF